MKFNLILFILLIGGVGFIIYSSTSQSGTALLQGNSSKLIHEQRGEVGCLNDPLCEIELKEAEAQNDFKECIKENKGASGSKSRQERVREDCAAENSSIN